MTFENATQSKPAITIARSDHDRLWGLAERLSDRNPDVSDQLLAELDRAEIVPDEQLQANVVRMGTPLRFTTDTGEDRAITLVFPNEADISAGKVSVFTPIGAALIGLSSGQSIDWTGRNGHPHRLTVESVNGISNGNAAG
ncbi:MAG: nucleoside diphosphate kinase regulator [Rhodospirillales bacterium]